MAKAPRTLGPYQVQEEIGEGGMARVYRVRKHGKGPDLAAKVLREHFEDQGEVLHRFLREAKILQDLDHPQIVKVLDVGPATTPAWFVMEWVPGASLAEDLHQRRPVGDERALRLMADVLAGLDHAHSRGIVHRDLKPENVLVDAEGRARLSDFGIAKLLEGTQLTATGTRLGTPHYMAPEQIRGRRSVGVGADIYAAGVLFYELLSGKRPFDGEDPVAIGYCHAYEAAPPMKRRGKAVPEVLVPLVEKAMEKKVTARWRTARSFRAALVQASGTLEVELPALPRRKRRQSATGKRKGKGSSASRPASRRPTSSSPGLGVPVRPGRRHSSLGGGEASLRWILVGLVGLVLASLFLGVSPGMRPGLEARSPAEARRAQELFLQGLRASENKRWSQSETLWRQAATIHPGLLPVVRDHAAQAFEAALAAGERPAAQGYLDLIRWADPGWVPGLDYRRRFRERWPH